GELEEASRDGLAEAAADGRGSTAETVEKLVRKGVLKEEEVPGKLRGRLDRRGRARKLLQHGDRHIDALSTPIASELQAASVARNLELYREVAPDVLSLGGISFLAQLCVTLMAMQARPELPQKLRVLIPETLRATARPQLLETLVGMVTDAEIEKERRLHVLKVLRMLGERGVWAMVELLRVSEDRWVRRSTLDALAEMGTSVEPVALSQLERSDNAWYVIRNLLALLEKVGTQASQSAVGRLLEHRDARLRALAVTAYAKLVGKGAMGALLGMIEDANADVRMAVIEQLGRLKCSEPKLTRLYAQIFDLSRDYDARFRMAACVALAAAGNIPVGDSDAETLLCTALASAKRGFLGLGRKKLLEPQVQEVMCRVLGIFGGKKAREVLAPIAKRDQTEVGDAARNALAEIEGRSSKR
ncbi:MAG: HEAT repeat domain-containing protein, partial [Deltaproteobacteria bacterium]|nr:HEAT repeat domain-containing protein [Deltaproteobacteria bacterium]